MVHVGLRLPQLIFNVIALFVSFLIEILTRKCSQFLQPTPLHLTVKEYVTPEKFAFWKEYGESIGFRYVASGPLVSSCYSLHFMMIISLSFISFESIFLRIQISH
jgi:lipoate synthase